MMNRRLIYCILSGALTASLLAGCSKDVPKQQNDAVEPCSIMLEVKGKTDTRTRTPVEDPDDTSKKGKQHVTRIQLYIYEQDAAGTDFTCVASEDVKWTHLQGAMDGLETRKQGYTTVYQDYKDGVDYRFVAMGFDDTFTGPVTAPVFEGNNSVAAYGKPDAVAKVGDKLSAGMFSLQAEAEVSLIARSELYAGARTFTKAELKNGTASKTPIELKRRVAGVLGYFKNLPGKIENRDVAKVVLRLYESQNTQVGFLPILPVGVVRPEDVTDDDYIDYVDSPYKDKGNEDGKVIASYQVPVTGPEATFSLPAYMLPIRASAVKDECTMELVILDAMGLDLAKRRVLYTPEVPATRNGTGIIGDGKNVRMQYPVRANQFYRIGTFKEPIDLSGQSSDIYIYIDPVWDEYYGGTLDGTGNGGIDIDKEWGSHDGGSIDVPVKPKTLSGIVL